MELDKVLKDNEVQTLDDQEDIEFGIDQEDEWIIFKSFTNYGDPISAMIREIVSNAYDAHLEAGVDEDVVVEITEENEFVGSSPILSIKDKGTGLSPEVMRTIYSRFGKSTKRDRPDSIGAFGFGAKSPLAYTDMFELITVVDGIKYHYSIHNGEKKPVITPMGEWEVDEPNGTEVRIYIKEGDTYNIRTSLRKNLEYFDGITYKNCDIDNDYQIIHGDHFIFNTNKSHNTMHLCLGKVYYPLNSDLINFPALPVGLKFDVGDIPVVWNRESVEYTDEAVEKINEKIELVRKEIQNIYNRAYESIDNLDDFFDTPHDKNILLYTDPITEEKHYIKDYSDSFIDTSPYYSKYKTLNIKKSHHLYRAFYKDGSNSASYSSHYSSYDIDNKLILMKRGEQHSSLKDKYIEEKYPWNTALIRQSNKKETVKLYMSYFFRSGFASDPYTTDKDIRQNVVKEAYQLYDEVVEWIKSKAEFYEDIEIPEEHIEAWEKEKEEERKRKEEEFYYLGVSTHGSFNSNRINGYKLPNRFGNEYVIYGFQDDREALKEVKTIIEREYSWSQYRYINVIQISMKNERVVLEMLREDRVFYIADISKVPFIQRIGKKYNLLQWKRELYNCGLDVGDKPNGYVPHYITPSEPTLEEKRKFYKTIGTKLKYPMLKYTIGSIPNDVLKEYKKRCPYHEVNPILIGKKHVKPYEDKRSKEQQSRNTDTGN